ncbi:helix-turn-helix domain-containing protein [Vagococcus entomophilus]|uniref:HTH cro/C1-type domain-containing protein n=1 Tax=Vagococcus entomophilus TaxID=1160095 RepID=A0A430AHT4_9ENTE|nr:helix-turn-helix transcriptional regulator [Vagococcus entomophilus]RSU07662.1 hypothetical protein CBF30_00010 [Vagococcus entomophilus]
MSKQQIKFGENLRYLRQQKRMTQKELSQGICAQSMISAIENGSYLPNISLAQQLAARLSISIEDLSLSDYYNISSTDQTNKYLEKLCNAKEYQKLYQFLLQETTIEEVQTQEQVQAYYYYLGCCEYQLNKGELVAEKSFRMALLQIIDQPKFYASTLTRQCYASLALTYLKYGQPQKCHVYFEKAFHALDKIPYEENQQILYFLRAVSFWYQKELEDSIRWLELGTEFAVAHNSHYLLGNMYALKAQVYAAMNNIRESQKAQQVSDSFRAVFSEKSFFSDWT